MPVVRNRRSPYRHRVRAHTRLGRPVKSFLRGKGKPRQPRKYRHVDGWVRKKVVVRKPPIRPPVVKRPPKPPIVKKPPIIRIRKPPPIVPPVVVKTRRALLDRLGVHKRNLSNTRIAGGQARTFDTKVRYYKEYLGHAKLYNDTVAAINKLRGKKLRPMKPLPLHEMQKKWTTYFEGKWRPVKPGWVRGLRPGDPRAPRAAKIIKEYDILWEKMERKHEREERMTPANRRKSTYNRIDITKEAIEVSDKYNELTGMPLTPYGRKLLVPEPVSGGLVLKQMFTKEQLSEYKKHKRELKKKRK